MERKGIRFVSYSGPNRASAVTKRVDRTKGYATDLDDYHEFVIQQLPQNERIIHARCQTQPQFPEMSIRELVANALIHQDLTITGAGPTVELFQNRIEFTNPGAPLIEPRRMVDMPPRSRNETMASLMRRMGMCEEQGTGLDKVFLEIELNQLPAPLLKTSDTSTQVILHGPRKFVDMSADERMWACYWHSVLKHLNGERMRNKGLCDRLGIHRHNASQATGVLNKTMDVGLIKFADDAHPRTGYVPFWA